ncbi:MAG: acyl-CoA dehydrogenase family protein, partial [Candidatus Hodarchaeales archaeon]
PKENILGPPGEGYRTTLERLIGMRMGVAVQSTALAERAYQLAKAYAKDRVQFKKPIITFPGVANKLRGMEIELVKMRRLQMEAAYVLSRNAMKLPIRTKYLKLSKEDEGTLAEFAHQYNWAVLHHTISKAKMYNSEVGNIMVDDALQIFGGNGLVKEYDVERLLRDFRVLRIYEGTSEIHEITLNRTSGIVTAGNMDSLMEVAMNAPSAKAAAPDPVPIDYQELFLRRFPSTMETFLDDFGDTKFLFDEN